MRPSHFGPCSQTPETEAAKARRDVLATWYKQGVTPRPRADAKVAILDTVRLAATDLVKSGKVDLYAPAYRVARPDLGPKLGPEVAGPAKPELADCHCTKEDQPPIVDGSIWCCGRCGRVRKVI